MGHRLRWASIALGVVIALGAVSYALARSGPSKSLDRTDLNPRREALRLWRGFSAEVTPRPLILTGQGPIQFPSGGFPSRADEAAFLTGRYRLRGALPAGPTTSGAYRVRSATAAYSFISHPIPGHRARPHGRLTVRAVRFGHARFKTDRGQQLLPAWRFFFVGVRDSAKVLAVRSSSVFTAPKSRKLQDDASPYPDGGATIALDDRTITLSFEGAAAGTGPCEANYTIASTASHDAVALTIIEHPGNAPTDQICPAGAYARTATIRLAQPLGARALISSNYATIITVRPQDPKQLSVSDAIQGPARGERTELGSYCLPSRPGVQTCADAAFDPSPPGDLSVGPGDVMVLKLGAPAISLSARLALVTKDGKVSYVSGRLHGLGPGYDWNLKLPPNLTSAHILDIFVRYAFGDASFEAAIDPTPSR